MSDSRCPPLILFYIELSSQNTVHLKNGIRKENRGLQKAVGGEPLFGGSCTTASDLPVAITLVVTVQRCLSMTLSN